ncbi:MAG: hypothetical protein JNL84_03775 [Candidatus Accumulibacter sp.]|nr:hypothetical protein [Accumulibacter sp.]
MPWAVVRLATLMLAVPEDSPTAFAARQRAAMTACESVHRLLARISGLARRVTGR